MFVDRATIEAIAGIGGDGCLSFRREKYIPRGGPDGGDGGHGGSVVIVAQEGVDNLSALAHSKFWRAEPGQNGMGANKTGRSGADLIIRVPPGTIIYDAENDFVLKDLTAAGDELIAAKGGRGGRGNTAFKNSIDRAPRKRELGQPGERRLLKFELKVIADVGLLGMPNAGKSTLLSRVSHARPEIADYPFTTKHPNLGRVQIDFDRSFVMADIPGLIEGAHAGIGLGHEFLRHIERAGILVHLVEPLPLDGSDPIRNYQIIREELVRYNEKLGARPEIPVISKSELPGAEEVRNQLQAAIGRDVLMISAVTGQGLNQLTAAIAKRLFAPAEEA